LDIEKTYAEKVEKSSHEEQDVAGATLLFRKWRRRVVEQIVSRSPKDGFDLPGLSPAAKLVAYSIANRLHPTTRTTPSSSLTIGKPVGLKPDKAQKD
jgi:hypothetical protein